MSTELLAPSKHLHRKTIWNTLMYPVMIQWWNSPSPSSQLWNSEDCNKWLLRPSVEFYLYTWYFPACSICISQGNSQYNILYLLFWYPFRILATVKYWVSHDIIEILPTPNLHCIQHAHMINMTHPPLSLTVHALGGVGYWNKHEEILWLC